MPYALRSWNERGAGCDRTISHAGYPKYTSDALPLNALGIN